MQCNRHRYCACVGPLIRVKVRDNPTIPAVTVLFMVSVWNTNSDLERDIMLSNPGPAPSKPCCLDTRKFSRCSSVLGRHGSTRPGRHTLSAGVRLCILQIAAAHQGSSLSTPSMVSRKIKGGPSDEPQAPQLGQRLFFRWYA